MSENKDTRTATQKIEDLEKVVTMLYQATQQAVTGVNNLMTLQRDMALVKDALKLLNKKTEAIIQTAAPETGITVASVSAIVVKMNVEDLKEQVAGYLANGYIVPAETAAADSFLVCEESDSEGKLQNPRIQFRLDSQDKVTQDALTGKKVGDTASFGEGKLSAKILEIYSLVTPAAAPSASEGEANAAPAAEAAPAETASAEAPAASAPAAEAAAESVSA